MYVVIHTPYEIFENNVKFYVEERERQLNLQLQELERRKAIPDPRSIKNKNTAEKTTYITKEGVVHILKYYDRNNIYIQYYQGPDIDSGYKDITSLQILDSNKNKNPYHPRIYKYGYIGVGPYISSIDGNNTVVYNKWHGMLRRCYSDKSLINHPTYKGCEVSSEWHNFQIFGAWFDWYTTNFPLDPNLNWAIDKDVLFKHNKIYSPNTCCLLPDIVNSCFTKTNAARGDLPIGVKRHTDGRYIARLSKYGEVKHIGIYDNVEEAFYNYKKEKEAYIKELANRFSYTLPANIVAALKTYEVEIDD